jgi:hypothetical protein
MPSEISNRWWVQSRKQGPSQSAVRQEVGATKRGDEKGPEEHYTNAIRLDLITLYMKDAVPRTLQNLTIRHPTTVQPLVLEQGVKHARKQTGECRSSTRPLQYDVSE